MNSNFNMNINNTKEALGFFVNNNNELANQIYETKLNSDVELIYFSDLHNGWRNLAKIIDVSNDLKVDAVINAGDTVLKYLDDPSTDFSWYLPMINNLNSDMITAIGNHDVWVNKYWEKADSVLIYDRILAPALNDIHDIYQLLKAVEKGLCYYYKDYQAVRIIVLNAMSGHESVEFWDEKEAIWLRKTLDDAKSKKKHVICVTHAPFPKDIILQERISTRNSSIDYKSQNDYDNIFTHIEAIKIIQDYIESGGIFICWLSGHLHVDEVLQTNGYNNQLMINIASARYSFHDDGIIIDDINSPYFYCFDYIGINTKDGIIKFIRFGWNRNMTSKSESNFKFNYLNHNIIEK